MPQEATQTKGSSAKHFESMNIKQLDSTYSVIARGAFPGVCDDWKQQIESAVDKHIDNYKKVSDKKSTDEKKK